MWGLPVLCWIPIVDFDNSEARAAEATRSTFSSPVLLVLKCRWRHTPFLRPRDQKKRRLWGRECAIHASSARAGSSQQTTHYSTQNDSPVPLFFTNIAWVLKTHLRASSSPITRSIKDIFNLKTKQNTDPRELIDRRTTQPDGDDHWPVTVTSRNVFPRCPEIQQ